MKALSHCVALLSIGLGAGAGFAAPAKASPFFGRWSVSENHPVFTARGRLYKTFDIAPCGKDFCGVSVGDNGKCGPMLFRFLTKHADGTTLLDGHGKWGDTTKTVQIDIRTGPTSAKAVDRQMNFFLGDGHDFGDRSGNMAKFHAMYRPTGKAICTAS